MQRTEQMGTTFTPEQAIEILDKKSLAPEALRDLLANQSLKSIAKQYKIGHVRLSACAHALNLYSKTNGEKIAQIHNRRYEVRLQENQFQVDEGLVESELAIKTVKRVAKEQRLSLQWLEDFCAKKNITPIELSELPKIVGDTRKAVNEQKLLETHKEELVGLLEAGTSIREITRQLPFDKRIILRASKELFPEYFTLEAKKERTLKESFKNGALGRESQYKNAVEEVSRLVEESKLYKTDHQLEDYVYQELNSYSQLAMDMNVQLLQAKQILETRLGVTFADDLVWLMSRGKRVLERGAHYKPKKYDWVLPFLEAFEISIPKVFSRHPGIYALFVVESKAEYLEWVIKYSKVKTKEELVDILPGYSKQPLFYLFYKLFDDQMTTVVDSTGKEKRVFLDKDPLPSARELSNQDKRQALIDFFSSEEGEELVEMASTSSQTKEELLARLAISNHKWRMLVAEGILPKQSFKFSAYENVIRKFLVENAISHETHVKNVLDGNKELDFYFPQLNLAIEVNPTYTHNSTYGWGFSPDTALPKGYHQKKVKEAAKKGVTLIMLYEKDLIEPNLSSITLPFLRFKLLGADETFHGREVEIFPAANSSQKKEAMSFIEKYHAQGNAPAKYYYMVVHKATKRLLGVCSFVENKYIHRGEVHIELKRMVFLPAVQVRFALSKMVKQFFRDHKDAYTSLYSYSRNDMGNGNAYQKAGFSFVRDTEPTLSYVNPANPYDSYSWSINSPWGVKSGLIAKTFTPETIEAFGAEELIKRHLPRRTGNGKGYVSVYNSGNKLWVIDNPF